MIAAIAPWIVFGVLMLGLFAVFVVGPLLMSGRLSDQERREMNVVPPQEHQLTARPCARCHKLHTRESMYCCGDCEWMHHYERNSPDLFAGATARPLSGSPHCDSTHHQILPKKQIPRVAVPAAQIKHRRPR